MNTIILRWRRVHSSWWSAVGMVAVILLAFIVVEIPACATRASRNEDTWEKITGRWEDVPHHATVTQDIPSAKVSDHER